MQLSSERSGSGGGGGGAKYSSEIRRCAEAAVRGLAGIDEDAVWTMLALSAAGNRAMPIPIAPTWATQPGGGDSAVTLPSFREILPPLARSEEVPAGVAQASLRMMVACGFASSAASTGGGDDAQRA